MAPRNQARRPSASPRAAAHRGARRRRPRRPWHRTRAYRLTRTVALTVVLVVGGVRCAGGADGSAADPADPGAGGTRADARGGQQPLAARPARGSAHPPAPPRPLPRSRAVRLAIPYLGVDAPVGTLRLDRDRRMTAPPDDAPRLVGWYADGPSPGERGTAVAVGHLDTKTGPAVFAGLPALGPGHLVEARRADGRGAVYTVDAVRTYDKAHFPDREVYGARGRPELRLITCGGAYDRRTGYTGNVVVFAHLTRTLERTR
ncbi:class F sortase [Streptomyces sp. V3I7]|uniref:class F sortase n=1 Tax=Streptomyces sp. V3I7 TaxID=3042278 RepID=UPI00278B77BE|nr:class F sortase [Streptomyces sp. V3I7]MDQ0990022.1 sortase (surface protein transpeptidase) [Streptomyces sp. V3I7]